MHILSGRFKGRQLHSPAGLGTRPTSSRLRESLFNICQNKIAGALFLDLFAGSGSIGLEALSRGASRVVFIDNNREAVRSMKANIAELGVAREATVHFGDVFHQLEKMAHTGESFDIIYADPPYDLTVMYKSQKMSCYAALLDLIESSSLLKSGGWLFIEDSAKALAEEPPLRRLKLTGKRKLGRSTLVSFA